MTLCWPPICLRIDFEILLITFNALQGLSQNIYPNCCPPANRCSARSLLTIPMLKHEKDEVFILRFLRCGMDCLRNSSSLHQYPLLNCTFIFKDVFVSEDFFSFFFSWLDHLIQGVSRGCLGSFRKRLYLKINISTS